MMVSGMLRLSGVRSRLVICVIVVFVSRRQMKTAMVVMRVGRLGIMLQTIGHSHGRGMGEDECKGDATNCDSPSPSLVLSKVQDRSPSLCDQGSQGKFGPRTSSFCCPP